MSAIDRITDLMLRVGEANAARAANSGSVWGKVAIGLGDLARQHYQGVQEDRQLAEQQAYRDQQMQLARNADQRGAAQDSREAQAFAMKQRDAVLGEAGNRLQAILAAPTPELKGSLWRAFRPFAIGNKLHTPDEIPDAYPGDDVVKAELTGVAGPQAAPKPPEPFTLNPGDVRYGPDGKQIATNPKPAEPAKPEEQEWVVRGGKVVPIAKGGRQPGDRPYTPPSNAQPEYEWVERGGQPIQIRKGTAQAGDKPYSNASDKPPTQGQFLAGGFAGRIKQAEDVLGKLDATIAGMNPISYSAQDASPYAGFKSNDFQSFDQAARNFVNAVLRRESGAAISPSEFDSARKQYLPQPGDSKETLAQKKANRDYVFETLKREAGNGYAAPVAPPEKGKIRARDEKGVLHEADAGTPLPKGWTLEK